MSRFVPSATDLLTNHLSCQKILKPSMPNGNTNFLRVSTFYYCLLTIYRGSSICVASIYVISVLRRYCLETITRYMSSKIHSCVIFFSSPRYTSIFDVNRIHPKTILSPTQKVVISRLKSLIPVSKLFTLIVDQWSTL